MALFDVTELQYIKTGVEEKKVEDDTPAKNYSYDDLVHLDKKLELHESYDDFTKEKYSSGIVFYDFEIFKYDWLVVLLDPVYKELKVKKRALWKYGYKNKNEFGPLIVDDEHLFDKPKVKKYVLNQPPFRRPKEDGDFFDKDIHILGGNLEINYK